MPLRNKENFPERVLDHDKQSLFNSFVKWLVLIQVQLRTKLGVTGKM